MRVFAERNGSQVKVRVDSEYLDYQIQVIGGEVLEVMEG